ncbi:CGNR zinc finger domain-containing protein [Nocardia beijingensis]|uniref:CGNR zinc finger domain-containing protein n=1 Tax=Nocardia beijingensis TaxID=95162 RepID=UPI00082DD8CE|nr:CGNR zinc finger domain-containing protein [Nocardia beijingensis]
MFTFVSGNLALDFAGTVKARSTTFEDVLTSPAALADWIVAARLLDNPPPSDADTLARAVRLREAAYRMAVACTRDSAFDDADRRTVNEFAGSAPPSVSLRPDGTVLRAGDADAALAAIARSAIELLGSRALVKECGRAACTRLYVDTSRGGSRRWCDMTLCGNRAKSAAFRARHGAP